MAGDTALITDPLSLDFDSCSIVPAQGYDGISQEQIVTCEVFLADEEVYDEESVGHDEHSEQEHLVVDPAIPEPCIPPDASEGSPLPFPCDDIAMSPQMPSESSASQDPTNRQSPMNGQFPMLGQGQGAKQESQVTDDVPKVQSVQAVAIPSVYVATHASPLTSLPLPLRDIAHWTQTRYGAIDQESVELPGKALANDTAMVSSTDQWALTSDQGTSELSPRVAAAAVLLPIVEPKSSNGSIPKLVSSQMPRMDWPYSKVGAGDPSNVEHFQPPEHSESEPAPFAPETNSAGDLGELMPPSFPPGKRTHPLIFLALVGLFSFSPTLRRRKNYSRVRDIQRLAKPLRVEPVEDTNYPQD